jgi:hypothetical protein
VPVEVDLTQELLPPEGEPNLPEAASQFIQAALAGRIVQGNTTQRWATYLQQALEREPAPSPPPKRWT